MSKQDHGDISPYHVLSVTVLLCLGQMPALAGAWCGIRDCGGVVIAVCEGGLGGVRQGTTAGADKRANLIVDELGGAAFATDHPCEACPGSTLSITRARRHVVRETPESLFMFIVRICHVELTSAQDPL